MCVHISGRTECGMFVAAVSMRSINVCNSDVFCVMLSLRSVMSPTLSLELHQYLYPGML